MQRRRMLLYRLMTFFLTFSLIMGAGSVPASAKKSPSLSSKKLTVKVGKTATLKLKNNTKKVTWKVTSGKERVKLTSRGKSSVRIQGKKKGKAVVVAKLGKASYTCHITVKKGDSGNSSTGTGTDTSKPGSGSTPVPDNASTSAPEKNYSPAPGTVSTSAPGTNDTPAPGISGSPVPGTDHTLFPDVTNTSVPASTGAPVSGTTDDPMSGTADDPQPGTTNAPGGDSDVTAAGLTLSLGSVSISLGESLSSVKEKLGEPIRVDVMPQGFDGYVYNPGEDYTSYMIIGIQDDTVVTCFTMAEDFYVEDHVQAGDSLSALTSAGWLRIAETEALLLSTADGNIMAFGDIHGNRQIYGVQLYTTDYTEDQLIYGGYNTYDETKLTAMERQIFEITNAFRVHNGLNILQADSRGDRAAKLHSQDMADNNYFEHISQGSGYTCRERITNVGITSTAWGENIIAGYSDGITMAIRWIASEGHRKNILNEIFNYLGCGVAYEPDSDCETYGTQDFWR